MHAYISNICMNKYISICLIVYIYIYIQKFKIIYVYTHTYLYPKDFLKINILYIGVKYLKVYKIQKLDHLYIYGQTEITSQPKPY